MAVDLQTWAGSHRFGAAALVEASSVDDVVRAVRTRSGRLRALGTRHSFHDLADTDGTLVSLVGADPDPVLDVEARTVSVGAGTRYGVLAAWLEERGWALHNLGSLPHISVGGATATGTHGSGDSLGSLSSAVRGLEVVGADGQVRRVGTGHAELDGSVVHLGALGIVTRVTLAVEPTYLVRQDGWTGLPWDVLLDQPELVTGSGYSVSVLTRWAAATLDLVLRKTRVDDPALPRQVEWLGARRAGVEALGWSPETWTEHGSVGPWLHRLPHFRLEATPSAGEEIQTEYFVPREAAPDALRAVRALGERIDRHLLITELRTVAADRLWLSGAYRRDALAIHFTWAPHPAEVAALLPPIEAALAPFEPRPHWGKWHAFDAARLASAYPRLADARALFEAHDPAGVFANAHLERLGLR